MNRPKTKRCNPTNASQRQWQSFVVAETNRFQLFDQDVTQQLEELESKWAHVAAPSALRSGRSSQA